MVKSNSLRALVLASALAAASPAVAQDAPQAQAPEEWRALALSDLDAAREILRAQTPIPFDTENPAYPAWLEAGYGEARAMAEHASDRTSAYYPLTRYVNGFGDPHISVRSTAPLPTARWPGFVAAADGEGAIVVLRDESDPVAPAVGARILTCEGAALQALAAERIYPFTFNPRLALDRRRAVTRLFLDRGVSVAPAPAQCIFADAGGAPVELRWRDLPADANDSYWPAYQRASMGDSAEWGVAEAAPGVFWIGIPTFASGEETAPRLAELIEQINARAAAMRNGRAIVIDVRGNGGGNSAWADRIAVAIFGERVVQRAARASRGRTAIDWRASPENIAYWREWMTEVAIPEFGENSEAVDFANGAVAGMESALGRNPPLWRQGPRNVRRSGGLTSRRPRGDSPFAARVYVLTNGTCGSSCLNFADTVLFVPGVMLIGSATSGDGPYMEVRNVALPSGFAELTIPQKVWRGMPRGALEAYEPDIAYEGVWDDASVRAWVMGLVARE